MPWNLPLRIYAPGSLLRNWIASENKTDSTLNFLLIFSLKLFFHFMEGCVCRSFHMVCPRWQAIFSEHSDVWSIIIMLFFFKSYIYCPKKKSCFFNFKNFSARVKRSMRIWGLTARKMLPKEDCLSVMTVLFLLRKFART